MSAGRYPQDSAVTAWRSWSARWAAWWWYLWAFPPWRSSAPTSMNRRRSQLGDQEGCCRHRGGGQADARLTRSAVRETNRSLVEADARSFGHRPSVPEGPGEHQNAAVGAFISAARPTHRLPWFCVPSSRRVCPFVCCAQFNDVILFFNCQLSLPLGGRKIYVINSAPQPSYSRNDTTFRHRATILDVISCSFSRPPARAMAQRATHGDNRSRSLAPRPMGRAPSEHPLHSVLQQMVSRLERVGRQVSLSERAFCNRAATSGQFTMFQRADT